VPNADHRRHQRPNNTENSQRLVRTRERVMQRFKSSEQAQPFLVTFSSGATTSVHGGTVSQPGATARSCASDSAVAGDRPSGANRVKGRDRPTTTSSLAVQPATALNLSMPDRDLAFYV
jgi:hypothetical protein